MPGSARFHRRVCVQDNRPRASRLRASGVRAVQGQYAGDATERGDPAGGYAGVPTVFLQHTRVSSGDLAREQGNPEVCRRIGIANQFGFIVSSQGSTTSSSSYSSSIVRARPQHLKKACEPSYRASSDPFAETSSPWQADYHRHGSREEYLSSYLPPTAISDNFFVTHGTSSPSSFSHRRSCSSREFTFHLFSSTTKATPRFALTH
jgi:hypothetical protein